MQIKTKIRLIGADIYFLKKCMQLKLTPKFAKFQGTAFNNINFSKAIKFAQEKYLRLEIANHYRNRSRLEIQAYPLHLKLSQLLNRLHWDIFEEKMYHVIEHKYETKQKIHDNKLKALISEKSIRKDKVGNNSSRNEDNFSENSLSIEWEKDLVRNDTDVVFSDDEINILKLGLKTSFAPSKIPIEDIIVGIEMGVKNIDFQNQDKPRKQCSQFLQRNLNQNNFDGNRKHFRLVK